MPLHLRGAFMDVESLHNRHQPIIAASNLIPKVSLYSIVHSKEQATLQATSEACYQAYPRCCWPWRFRHIVSL